MGEVRLQPCWQNLLRVPKETIQIARSCVLKQETLTEKNSGYTLSRRPDHVHVFARLAKGQGRATHLSRHCERSAV
jgi:hypothetical protein